jgi:hypothetical protein
MACRELLWMNMIEALLYVFAVNEDRLRKEVAFAENAATAELLAGADVEGAFECSTDSGTEVPIRGDGPIVDGSSITMSRSRRNLALWPQSN